MRREHRWGTSASCATPDGQGRSRAAGVSAGIDLAMWLAGQIGGEAKAKAIQLMIEYDPQPPFDSGTCRRRSVGHQGSATALLSKDMIKPEPLQGRGIAGGRRSGGYVFNGQLYTSSDAEQHARESNRTASRGVVRRWPVVGGGVRGGQLYTSIDAGVSWTAREANRRWYAVASSADGQRLVAATTNGGQDLHLERWRRWSWTRESNRAWIAVASSHGWLTAGGCCPQRSALYVERCGGELDGARVRQNWSDARRRPEDGHD